MALALGSEVALLSQQLSDLRKHLDLQFERLRTEFAYAQRGGPTTLEVLSLQRPTWDQTVPSEKGPTHGRSMTPEELDHCEEAAETRMHRLQAQASSASLLTVSHLGSMVPGQEGLVGPVASPRLSLSSHESMATGDSQTEQTTEVRVTRDQRSTEYYRKRVSKQARQLAKARLKTMEMELSEISICRRIAKQVASSACFTYSIMSVILFNLFFLGLEVSVSSQIGHRDIPVAFIVVNCVVVVFFMIEVALNLLAFGWKELFCGKERGWNLFDLTVISLSVLEMVVEVWSQVSGASEVSQGGGQVLFMRMLRLARAMRGIRVMRLLRYVASLRTLVLSIASSIWSLMWTALLLILIIYSFAVILTQLVNDFCRYETVRMMQDTNAVPSCRNFPDLERYWSSLSESMLTLFFCISGGVDWSAAMLPLGEVSALAGATLVLYIIITVFAVINVVTGVFCNTAIESAAADKDIAIMKQMQRQKAQVESLRGFFETIQTVEGNVGNQVSLRDLKEALTRDKLSGFLESMGISTQDVWSLFMIIDADRSGLIDLEEFVAGCMQLHGPAKSLHVAKMSHDNKVTRLMIQHVEACVAAVLAKVDKLLSFRARAGGHESI